MASTSDLGEQRLCGELQIGLHAELYRGMRFLIAVPARVLFCFQPL